MRSLHASLASSKRRYPLAVWAGAVFSVALAVSGIYWNASRIEPAPGSTWLTLAQLNAEYHVAAQDLTLPAGVTWPDALPYVGIDEDGSSYTFSTGVGAEWAEWYWLDSWAAAAVSTETTAARQAAIEQLPRFYEMSAYTSTADRGYFDCMISDAQSGNCTALAEYVANNEALASDDGDQP